MDLLPAINDLVIVDKTATPRRLGDVMHWPQRHLINHVSQNMTEHVPTRVIILKARQLGISTIIKGIEFYLAMMIDHFTGQTVTHQSKSNEWLLSMSQTYFDNYRYKRFYTQANKAANKRGWEEVNSRLSVNTAKTFEGSRSQTLHLVHASEVAFWPNAKTLMTGMGAAVPKTWFSFMFLESTANGIGDWFCTTWDKAVAGQSDYVPMFFPWQTHPEYIGTFTGIEPLDARYLDEEEAALAAEFARCRIGDENALVLSRSMSNEALAALRGPMPRDEILSRLAWRRSEIRTFYSGDSRDFLQEYPHKPSVAFLTTGSNVFQSEALEVVYRPAAPLTGDLLSIGGRIKFVENPAGPLRIYHPPVPNREYVIGGDPAFTKDGDYACAQVIDPIRMEQVAVWRGKTDPGEFGVQMCRLGYWYNEALLAPETNKDGATTMGRIQGLAYPNIWMRQIVDNISGTTSRKLGWHTNTATKPEAIGNLKLVVADESLILHDHATFMEMRNYVDLGGGQYGNANGELNDDTVMSLAIAVTVSHYESEDFNAAPEMLGLEELRKNVNEMMLRTGRVSEGLALMGGGGHDAEAADW